MEYHPARGCALHKPGALAPSYAIGLCNDLRLESLVRNDPVARAVQSRDALTGFYVPLLPKPLDEDISVKVFVNGI